MGDLSIFPKNIKKIVDLKIASLNRDRVKSGSRKIVGGIGPDCSVF